MSTAADLLIDLAGAGERLIEEALGEARRRNKTLEVDHVGCNLEEMEIRANEFRKYAEHLIFLYYLGIT